MLLVFFWLGLVAAHLVTPLQMLVMAPAMLGVMLYRAEHYTQEECTVAPSGLLDRLPASLEHIRIVPRPDLSGPVRHAQNNAGEQRKQSNSHSVSGDLSQDYTADVAASEGKLFRILGS